MNLSNRIITAALMGYFMIIVFSVAGIPDPNKKIDSLTGATKSHPESTESISDYSTNLSSANLTSLSGRVSLQKALMQRCSNRIFDHDRPIDFQILSELAREVGVSDKIRIFGINNEQLFVFKNDTTTFEPVSEKKSKVPREICFADFVKKAPGVLFITGKDDHEAYMEAGRFCQAMSLNLQDREIGSCIVAWFDTQTAKTELSLDDDQQLLLVLTLGFSVPATN